MRRQNMRWGPGALVDFLQARIKYNIVGASDSVPHFWTKGMSGREMDRADWQMLYEAISDGQIWMERLDLGVLI